VPALVYDSASAALHVAEAHTILDDAACFSRMTMPILSCLCGEDDARVHRLLTSPCGSSAVAEDAARRGVAEVLRGVGALVFDDGLNALMKHHKENGGASTVVLLAVLMVPYYRRSMDYSLTDYNAVDSRRKWRCNLCIGYIEIIW
jgi:hypothetical protein